MSPPARARPLACLLLMAMILAIGLSPRIRIPGLVDRALDLRLQDFLVLIALAYLGTNIPTLRAVWGPWAVLFVLGGSALTVARLLVDPSIDLLQTVAYLGRGIELFVLAAVVAGLFRLAGGLASRVALYSLLAAVAANLIWVLFQLATGTKQTLLNPAVGDGAVAYGPRLIGEGSAYGTGIFFVVAAALGCACWLNGTLRRPVALALMAAGAFGAFVAQSRVSLGGIAVCLLLLLVLPVGRGRAPFGAWVSGLTAVVLVYAFGPGLPDEGRLSEGGFEGGLADRASDWYQPLFDILLQGTTPLTGIGVGRLGTSAYPDWTEAHNLFLRAWLDYGLVLGTVWLAVFATAAVRALRASSAAEPSSTRFWATFAGITMSAVLATGLVQESLAAVTSTHLAMLALGLFAGSRPHPAPPEEHRDAAAAPERELAR